MRLTASTSLQAVRERVGVGAAETLRESEKRRRYLQTYARLLTTARPTVRFDPELRTATTDHDGTRPAITVTTRPFDQPVTDFRRRVFDLAVQEALVVHEVGHLRYTDVQRFRDRLATVQPDRRRMFSRVWNTLEDGAVERQLRHRYAVATELELLNANLFRADTLGHESADGEVTRLSLFHAVVRGLADMAVYDSGRFRRLLDDDAPELQLASLRDERVLRGFVAEMRETVRAVLTEPDPAARTERVWSFWTALVDALADAQVSGAGASDLAGLLDADGTVRVGDTGRRAPQRRPTDGSVLPETGAGAPVPGKPDDTDGEFGRTARQADDLVRESVAAETRRQVASAVGTEQTSDAELTGGDRRDHHDGDSTDATPSDASAATGGQTSDDTDGPGAVTADEWPATQSHPGAGRVPGGDTNVGAGQPAGSDPEATGEGPAAGGGSGDPEAAVRDRYREELAAEAAELDRADARIAELQAYRKALATVDDDEPVLRVLSGSEDRGGDGTGDEDRWRSIQRAATRLARRFRSRLRERRRDVERPRCRRGAFDRGRLVAASRGQPDVFTRTEAGEDRRYTCVVVLDRSGSMGDGAVTAAETGAVTAALALESVGVDVTVLDLHDSTVRLVKTSVEDVVETRGRLLTGHSGGGTPLSTALGLARARFQAAENPFVLVVTDGQPDDEAAYVAELDAVTFPVLGVYLTDSERERARPVAGDRSYFHQLAVVEDWSSLDRRLQRLAERVLF